jgi:hypothetical protein
MIWSVLPLVVAVVAWLCLMTWLDRRRRGRGVITIGGDRIPPGCEGPAIRSLERRIEEEEFRELIAAEIESGFARKLAEEFARHVQARAMERGETQRFDIDGKLLGPEDPDREAFGRRIGQDGRVHSGEVFTDNERGGDGS